MNTHPSSAPSLVLLTLVSFFAACSPQPRATTADPVESVPVKEATVSAALSSEPTYPLAIGPTGRTLVGQEGSPFFLSGDAAWSLVAQVSQQDAVAYLDDRRQRGFNGVLVSLVEHEFATNAPANFYGEAPFNGRPFTNFNEAYFDHADAVISAAAQRDIVVFLFPAYLGWDCGQQGWCAEVRSASAAEMKAWGRFVGERYQSFDNVVWVIGGDTIPPSDVKGKLASLAEGIREFDTRHLITSHNTPAQSAREVWPPASYPWHQLNNVYTDNITYGPSKQAYEATPVQPFFNIEGYYENEHGMTARQLRAQAYWTVLSGAFGYVFGNCPIWHFGSSASWCGTNNWRRALDSEGAHGMTNAKRLFTSRSWHLLEPDFDHQVLTRGYGSWGSSGYVTAARASDGSSVIAYLPSRRRVTVDMSKIAGSEANVWWYQPSDGSSSLVGTFPTSGSQRFRPSNSSDWVLVIDNAELGLAAPGTDSGSGNPPPDPSNQAPAVTEPATVTPAPVSGSQANLSVLGDDDAGEGALTYTWSTQGSQPGAVSFSPNGTNAAKQSTVSFGSAGTYTLRATLRDNQGATATSDVEVRVDSTPTRVAVTPASATVMIGAAQAFTGVAYDQFDNLIESSPPFDWTVSGGGTISSSGLFQAGNTPGGPFDVEAMAMGLVGGASVTVSAAEPMPDTLIDFEDSRDGTVLDSEGGISWGSAPRWRVWDGSNYRGGYSHDAYVDTSSRSEVTATFALPEGTVLKSLRLATPSGATSTVKFTSPGNPERVYTGISTNYVTKQLDWQVAAAEVTVRVSCWSQYGASDVAFDDLTYGAP